jgi:hypothetical protein
MSDATRCCRRAIASYRCTTAVSPVVAGSSPGAATPCQRLLGHQAQARPAALSGHATIRHRRTQANWRRRSLLLSLRERAMLSMTKPDISGGSVHDVPEDLRKTLASDAEALAAWEDLTPLARNEWICWAISVKKPETRKEHVERVRSELKEGMRRPCCWYGCIHRTDKAVSPSVQYVLSKKSKKSS